MNTKDDVCNSIINFQEYLGEILSSYQINEAICDFFDNAIDKFKEYDHCLGYISVALKYRQRMLCYLLFFHDKESKSILSVLNQISSNRVLEDKAQNKKLKSIACQVANEINKYQLDIKNLVEYRYDVYAHWNTNIFRESWQVQFQKDHPINYENLLLLSKKCFEYFGDILVMMGEKPSAKSLIKSCAINHFIYKLKQ